MRRRQICGALFLTVEGDRLTCTRDFGHLTGMHQDGDKVPAPPRELEADKPYVICKIEYVRRGEHVHARVFVGAQRHALGKAGDLVFRVGEWQLFGAALGLGAAQTMGHFEVITEGEGSIKKGGD